MTEQASSGCPGCPGSHLSVEEWFKICRPSFRKRHPILFWGGLILMLLILVGVMKKIFGGEEADGLDRIALVEVNGPIMDVGPTLEWIRSIAHNQSVKAVLVRVDSPGGGAAASQEVYGALERLAQKMPVVVSMGATAASGGLMVSMAGERIYANPSTVTGSIGVRMDIPQLQGLMGKLGISQETLTTGPYKDATSVMRPMTPEDRAYLEKLIMNMHEQFVEIVAKGRKMAIEQVAHLANGKMYTGEEALSLGLIDALGGMDEALDWVAKKSGIPANRKLLKKPSSKTRLLERIFAIAQVVEQEVSSLASFGQRSQLQQPAFWY